MSQRREEFLIASLHLLEHAHDYKAALETTRKILEAMPKEICGNCDYWGPSGRKEIKSSMVKCRAHDVLMERDNGCIKQWTKRDRPS